MQDCDECSSIDPAPQTWDKGKLEVDSNWQRLSMDITHYEGNHYLTSWSTVDPVALLYGIRLDDRIVLV